MKRLVSKTSYPLPSSNTTKMRGLGPAAAKVLFASSSPAAASGLQPDSCWLAEKVMWVACGPAGSCRAMEPTARSLTYLQADSTPVCQEKLHHALALQFCFRTVLKIVVLLLNRNGTNQTCSCRQGLDRHDDTWQGEYNGEDDVGMLTSRAQQWPPGLPSPRGHMGAGLPGVLGQQGVEVVGVPPACSWTK